MNDRDLAGEVERQLRNDGLRIPLEELSDASPHAMIYRRVQLDAPSWRQIVIALRREPEKAAPEFSPFWLIERGQATHHEPTIWWKGGDVRTWPSAGEDWKGKDWTESAPEARRFKTREEALRLAENLFGTNHPSRLPSFSITEHCLLDDPGRQPEIKT